jgi:hypothetical protein
MSTPESDIFSIWEAALRDRVAPMRATELAERGRLTELVGEVVGSIARSLQTIYRGPVESPRTGVISMWDLAALVGRDEQGRYCMGVGVGSVRLLDVLSAFLCSALFEESADAQAAAQQRIGAFSYDWARGLIERLRLWSIDPTLGLARPYGFVNLDLGSIVPVGRDKAHEFYFLAMLTWILAHEVSHIATDDLAQQATTEVTGMTAPHVRVDTQRPKPGREFQADLTALRVLFESHPGLRSPALSAVSFLLGVMQAVDDLGLEPTLSGRDHPSPAHRLGFMLEELPSACAGIDEDELLRLRALAEDLGTFAPRIAEWLLEAPGEFRSAPFVIEDYQDDAESEERAASAAEQNNAADAAAARGDLDSALALYTEAERTLRQASYGEGQRIVYGNLISTTFALQRAAEGLDWLVAGVDVGSAHNDKPAILYLLAVFDQASKGSAASRQQASARLGHLADADIQARVQRLRA